jgi:hypothetical protein
MEFKDSLPCWRERPLIYIQSQFNPVNTFESYLFMIRLSIIMPFVLKASSYLFPWGFPTKTLYACCISLILLYVDFIVPTVGLFGREYKLWVRVVFTDCKRANVSIEKKVFYSILIHFGVATKLVRPIKMCLRGAYCEIHIGKHLSYSERPKTRRCFIATALIVALQCFFLVSCVPYSSTLKIEAVRCPETSVDGTTRRYVSDDNTLHRLKGAFENNWLWGGCSDQTGSCFLKWRWEKSV